MRMAFLVAGLLAVASPTLAADPVGSYRVEGRNPGDGDAYSGTVQVSRTGGTYRVVWLVAGQQFVGTGIGDAEFMAISYTSGGSTGLALFGARGGNWDGAWTYAGGRALGGERWIRQ
ncbi:MAG: hypothetical protein H7Z10_13175 [Gemmatimonadaceae bacterium]|nr:hypothetical protein [Acetobacteraceae bacterium]